MSQPNYCKRCNGPILCINRDRPLCLECTLQDIESKINEKTRNQ